jgi:hypothetical protein
MGVAYQQLMISVDAAHRAAWRRARQRVQNCK